MLKSVLLCSKCAKLPTPRRFRPLSPLLDLATSQWLVLERVPGAPLSHNISTTESVSVDVFSAQFGFLRL